MKFLALSLAAILFIGASGCTTTLHSNENSQAQSRSNVLSEAVSIVRAYAVVNGIKMYYEIHGPQNGIPLVLVHGGGSTIDSAFSKILPVLSKTRRVIALEEQGHGRTEGRSGPVSFVQTADDISALLNSLQIKQVDIFGFSNGANSSLQLALRHPTQVRKLIFASSFTKRSGAVDGLWKMLNSSQSCMMPAVLKEAFLKVNSNEQRLKDMCEKDLARIRNFTNMPKADLRKVAAPTLILMGDKDVVKVSHGIELTKLLPNARLTVLPGDHGSYFGDAAASPSDPRIIEATTNLVNAFLSL